MKTSRIFWNAPATPSLSSPNEPLTHFFFFFFFFWTHPARAGSRTRRRRPSSTISLRACVPGGGWSGVFAAAFLLGRNATIAMFAFISSLRVARIPDADADQNRRSPRALGGVFHRDPGIQYLLIATSWYGLFSIFILVYGFLFLPSISVLAHDTESFLERSAKINGA